MAKRKDRSSLLSDPDDAVIRTRAWRHSTTCPPWASSTQLAIISLSLLYTRTCTYARARTHTHTRTHARTHTHTHARTHTLTHTHTHCSRISSIIPKMFTHTHTHTRYCSCNKATVKQTRKKTAARTESELTAPRNPEKTSPESGFYSATRQAGGGMRGEMMTTCYQWNGHSGGRGEGGGGGQRMVCTGSEGVWTLTKVTQSCGHSENKRGNLARKPSKQLAVANRCCSQHKYTWLLSRAEVAREVSLCKGQHLSAPLHWPLWQRFW